MYRSPRTKIHVPSQLHSTEVNSQFILFSVQGFCFSINHCSVKYETSNKLGFKNALSSINLISFVHYGVGLLGYINLILDFVPLTSMMLYFLQSGHKKS